MENFMIKAALIIEDMIDDLPDWKAEIVKKLIDKIFSDHWATGATLEDIIDRLQYRERHGEWPPEKDNYCIACHGIGEYRTFSGWRPCTYCNGRG